MRRYRDLREKRLQHCGLAGAVSVTAVFNHGTISCSKPLPGGGEPLFVPRPLDLRAGDGRKAPLMPRESTDPSNCLLPLICVARTLRSDPAEDVWHGYVELSEEKRRCSEGKRRCSERKHPFVLTPQVGVRCHCWLATGRA